MADASQKSDDAAAEEPIKLPTQSKLPMLMMAMGIAAIAIGGYLAFSANKVQAPAAHAEGEGGAEAGAEAEGADAGAHGTTSGKGMGPMVNLDTLVVNLNEPEELHYLKCGFTIEAVNSKGASAIESQTVRIRHEVIFYLSTLTVADSLGAQNKERIQKSIEERIRKVVGPVVNHVYLTEFVIQ